MHRPKKNPNQQSNNAPIERKRALSGDSLLVRATVGEGNFLRIDHMRQCLSSIIFILYQYQYSSEELFFFLGEGNDLLSVEAESINKPFILASTGERNTISTSGSDGGFLAKTKEGTVDDKCFAIHNQI